MLWVCIMPHVNTSHVVVSSDPHPASAVLVEPDRKAVTMMMRSSPESDGEVRDDSAESAAV